ncbi:unnamed protein product [Acanthoscelides obtectus]|uniref:Endonuclease/exonuclease/phosphatase domain-containing protein n=1 Tax=Acanthoscelides obtectus TaxID=200917 RepID=A0A9P0K4M2_ACAOB|nr:unnamed protein product [Acanthoscelides obtectus]CAK1633278.1 hypothetical protein AOBTE_LOCUS8010 [Acanthoscelides obtectus]
MSGSVAKGHPNKPFSELAAPKYGKGKPKQQEVKILHINVRSLRRKIDELEAFLVDEDIDVLCLTEHWLTKEEMEVVHLQGYMMKGFSERKDFTGNFDTFLESMEGILTQLSRNRQIILAGDFNVSFNTLDVNTSKLCDLLASFGLERTIFEPTRGDSCLDNVFLSSAMELCGSQVCDIGISDHKGQLVKFLGCETTGFTQNKKMYRPVTQRGLFMLHSRLSEISWDFITVDSTSGEQKFSHFMDILQEAYTYSFPKKTYVVRSDQGNNISWFNTELRAMREHLRFLRELKGQYGFVSDQYYKNYKNLYRNKIRKAKINANDNLVKSSSNPAKTVWNIINKKRGKSNKCPGSSDLSSDDFNNFFGNIAGNIVNHIPDVHLDPVNNIDFLVPPPLFSFSEVTFNEVRDVIDNLKNKNSKDIFGFNLKIVKCIKNIILIPLTRLIFVLEKIFFQLF